MAQRQKAPTMGENIRARREAADLSLAEMLFEVKSRLPRALHMSDETLRRYENGKTPEAKADTLLVITIADVLGCKISDLSEKVAEDARRIRELVSRSTCWFRVDAAHEAEQRLQTV